MDEHLQRHRRLPADRQDLGDREFAGEHDPLHPQPLGERDRLSARERHLRGAVEGEARADLPDERGRADVLHEHGIDAGGRHRFDHLCEFSQFVGEHERVERGVALEAAQVEHLHQRRQVVERKIRRAGPGVEPALQAEIHGIGPVFDRGPGTVPVARRGEEFGRGEGGAGWQGLSNVTTA